MKANNIKRVIVSVTNDLVTDNRVHKVCNSLTKFGFSVELVGRRLPGSPVLGNRRYSTRRMNLIFKKGPFFYAEYNLRLFLFLIFQKADIFLSNDLDTLPANFLASKIRRKTLVFDSHEYFTEVPELVHRPTVRKIWKWFEKRIVPELKFAYTVCGSIANLYFDEYKVKFEVVRNVPEKTEASVAPGQARIKTQKKVVIYQGAVNIGRGLPQVISAMHYLDDVLLLIVGSGDIIDELKQQVAEERLADKVLFAGRIPVGELKYYTACADLGLSIEEDLGLNYRFALTNKFFDYIAANVPVMITDLPEMAKIVRHYNIGLIIDSYDPQKLAENIMKALGDQNLRVVWKKNLAEAAKKLTWQNEELILKKIFAPLL